MRRDHSISDISGVPTYRLTSSLGITGLLETTCSWFDAEAGFARMAEFDSSTSIVMDLNMPDDETGEMIGFVMDMSIAQDITYKLTDTSNA